jgi:hypothetical protein
MLARPEVHSWHQYNYGCPGVQTDTLPIRCRVPIHRSLIAMGGNVNPLPASFGFRSCLVHPPKSYRLKPASSFNETATGCPFLSAGLK